ncbi:MAG: hypothetical protein HN578_06065 [Rhodospirillales bacterium]|jgi:hypothetical protein|nr:hypothetical protein [Rhodospirillaceae bacterium]MBT7770130.1 hypothetical protein [Rhodospirillales bacterium]MBT8002463.1 hypothetical protein [Rhodospirillales bacterium]
MRTVIITLMGLLFVTTPATSAGLFMDGNKLHDMCNKDTARDQGFCLGFITGVADSLEGAADILNFVLADKFKPGTCVPKNVNIGQLRDIAKKHLQDNPQSRHKSAWEIVSSSFGNAFPCTK